VNEILCPHCDKNIALEEGAFGLFECPHCDEEFSRGAK
jgi:ribosomal protein L37AE/L43A